MIAVSMIVLDTVADVEPYLDEFRERFHSWHVAPGAKHCWANVFPIVEQMLEGPMFEDVNCPAALAVQGALLAELASRRCATM